MRAVFLRLFFVLSALVLVSVVGVTALWFWAQSEGSLSVAIALAQHVLPARQTLVAEDATGSLLRGGHISQLRWKNDQQEGQQSLDARNIDAVWNLFTLLSGELRIDHLKIADLLIHVESKSSEPAAPPESLHLPLRADISASIEKLAISGTTSIQIDDIGFHYLYDGATHQLNDTKLRISSGTYQLKARLQDSAPMALNVQLQGVVQRSMPDGLQTLNLNAQAVMDGALAGQDARLGLKASIAPELKEAAGKSFRRLATRAMVDAQLQPWKKQAISDAKATWTALDLADWMPQAPHTDLSGSANIAPSGSAWNASLNLQNGIPGPWDARKLPIQNLAAKVKHQNGQWLVQSLSAHAAGGTVLAEGTFAGEQSSWHGKLDLQGIHSSQIDTRVRNFDLGELVLNGHAEFEQKNDGITFDVNVHDSAQDKSALFARGAWLDPKVHLQSLQFSLGNAVLKGKLDADIQTLVTHGDITLDLPGAHGQFSGGISSHEGEGAFEFLLSDANLLRQWLSRVSLSRQSSQMAVQAQAQAQVQAHVQVESWPDKASLKASWLGGWQNLALTLDLSAQRASLRAQLQAKAHVRHESASDFAVRMESAQVNVLDGVNTQPWSATLGKSVDLIWKNGHSIQRLDVSEGVIAITGPQPGQVQINWENSQWSRSFQSARWYSRGRVLNIPLAWLELMGQAKLADMGMRGDLVFAGSWDAKSDQNLLVNAAVWRTAGDLQLLSDTPGIESISAGFTDLHLAVIAKNEQIKSSFVWESQRGGNMHASMQTSLQQKDGQWLWPQDASVSGSLAAQLPPVGVWSVFAPPGWRLRGTLQADASLQGTRAKPIVRGSVKASDLAVKSVVDGIDFSDGRLNMELNGDKLLIQDFTLHGAGGAKEGGTLSAKGQVDLKQLRMDLTATLQGLRLLNRADRKVVISGNMNAGLIDNSLKARANLRIDHALVSLPDETAPKLGKDVQVRKPAQQSQNKPTPGPSSGKNRPANTDIAVDLNFGDDFQVRGFGVSTALLGNLSMKSDALDKLPEVKGALKTEKGMFKAYGQNLDIEYGVIRFNGAADNPALDVLAIRPNLQQRVGVQISGSALLPVIRLYSEPDLPDNEKLAWLVLGRSAASGGAESAMLQQATLAMLGGKDGGIVSGLTQSIGLDEMSLNPTTANADGSVGASVMLGKQLSRDLYVVYERSLTGTLGSLSIFYELTKRFALRAQTGEQSAVDLVFTHPYD